VELETMGLQNKVCLIVGATGAIGGAVARRFLQEGCRLALTYRKERPGDLVEELGGDRRKASLYPLDITDWSQIQTTLQRVEADFSGIDVLVNCTGIIGPIGRLEDTDPGEWTRAMEVNLTGSVNLARAVLPALRRRGHGKIVFFSGGGAGYGRPYFTAYSSAKAGLVRFTESLAQELEDADIQVNAVAPGAIKSRMWDEMRSAGEAGGPKLLEELRRMDETGGASADRAAALTAFLASDRSNRLTGRLVSAVWDDWENLDDNVEKVACSEVWTLRRVPLK
jgi:NAD(P)-dependent dehydrogenase (short-subunit alcohol dehydrogenase family)